MGSHIIGTICTELYVILNLLQGWPNEGTFRPKHVVISELKMWFCMTEIQRFI